MRKGENDKTYIPGRCLSRAKHILSAPATPLLTNSRVNHSSCIIHSHQSSIMNNILQSIHIFKSSV